MSKISYTWAVKGKKLSTSHRKGGANALKGFHYQEAHALHFFSQLLTGEGGLYQVRYEGAQDIDLMYGDGRQCYIQYKETSGTEYTFEAMREILYGFMRDVIDACGAPHDVNKLNHVRVEFILVSTGVFSGQDMMSLVRKTYTKKLARNLAAKFNYDDNPVKTVREKITYAEYVLRNVTVKVSAKSIRNQEQELLATARLALFGVPVTSISSSLAKLRRLTEPAGKEIFAADAAEMLIGLPAIHPASKKSPIKLLLSNRQYSEKSSAEKEFRESGRVSWAAIHYELDSVRELASVISHSVTEIWNEAGIVLISGCGGAGKSTLVSRVVWDLHRSGIALVFEITDPSKVNDDAWDEVVRLVELAGKPGIVMVDNIGSSLAFIEGLKVCLTGRIVVIATDRRDQCIPDSFPVRVVRYKLSEVSDSDLTKLAIQSGSDIDEHKKRNLHTFMKHGDYFALSLAIRGLSLDNLAEKAINRVNSVIPEFSSVFLSICACGVFDQTIPKNVLLRKLVNRATLEKALNERLVYAEANDRIRSGHASLALSIIKVANAGEVRLKIALLSQIDVNDIHERRFGLGILQNGLDKQAKELVNFTSQIAAFAASISEVGDYLDLHRCMRVVKVVINYGGINLNNSLQLLINAAGPERVRTGHDANLFMFKTSYFKSGFPVVMRVFEQYGITFGRHAFLRWVSRKGKNYEDLQIQASELHFSWLQFAEFPTPETISLVSFITHGVPKPSESSFYTFENMLEVILNNYNFTVKTKAYLELLYVICEAIWVRVRSKSLCLLLIDKISVDFTAQELAANPRLLSFITHVARLAGGDDGKKNVLSVIIPLLPDVSDDRVRGVFLDLPGLFPETHKAQVIDFIKRLKNEAVHDYAHDASIIKEFSIHFNGMVM